MAKKYTDGTYTATPVSANQLKYGVRDKVIEQKSFGNFTNLTTYTDSLQSYWQDSKKTITVKVNVTDTIVGYGVTIVDNISNITLRYPTDWTGLVTEEKVTFPTLGNDITVSDSTIKNDSFASILNRNTISQSNAIREADPVNDLKLDGSNSMQGSLDLNNFAVHNLVVQNVTELD